MNKENQKTETAHSTELCDRDLIEGVKALGEKYPEIEPELGYVAYEIRKLQIDRDLARCNCRWIWKHAEKLTRWVESARLSHEEVRDNNGRLKDTMVWVNFYNVVHKIAKRQKFTQEAKNEKT